MKNNTNYDSVVLVKREKLYTWNEEGPMYNRDHIPNSIELDDTIIETMGLYITRKEVALNKRKRYGEKPYLLEASPIEAVDVNYPDEFELAEYIMAGMREKEREKFRNLSRVLSSPMLSDIMDDLGLDGFIGGLHLNIKEKKVMGRAKTLKLRALNEGEDFKGIYDALESYKTIVPNDIIVVENEVSDYAYFGNLNANLAIRRGAVATIVGGKTRDATEVSKLDYAVFSTGNVARDVRKRATTESIYETIVLEKALEVLKTENKIISEILIGNETDQIVNNNGAF